MDEPCLATLLPAWHAECMACLAAIRSARSNGKITFQAAQGLSVAFDAADALCVVNLATLARIERAPERLALLHFARALLGAFVLPLHTGDAA